MQIIQNRRRFLAGAAAAGAGGPSSARLDSSPRGAAAGNDHRPSAAVLDDGGAYCWAGLDIAGELMRAEGFTTSETYKATSASTIGCGSQAARRISS